MAQMGAEKRQKNTDDYKDFLMSGKSNDAMTGWACVWGAGPRV